ncbi:metadherin a isoform X2 [Kryptolebias marmoratus]|uniref:Metadherin a n=1 Tax=Kryptolebias marmoratus TaxID=37003 RepID=A0A3Q3A2N2_KRYMA|nr:metadherin a isoform X2 [Kryptolebias marmoratus]
MAGDLRSFALEKAELLSSRLKELVSSGQGFVRAQLGVDLGLKPELYPTWVVLATAALGLLLLLGASWAAVCGKKRGSPARRSGEGEPGKADFVRSVKPEEHKKRSKKKASEKTQSNGQPVVVAQEEVKETVAVSKISPPIKAAKVHKVQAPVQVKKNKKKTKPDVKPVQQSHTNDGREPDDGVWETKVSNREKRQQRRKEKGSEDSGSSGGAEAPKTNMKAPVATKRNKGNHESQRSRAAKKGDAAGGAVSSTWRGEPSVNGNNWSDVSLKAAGQMGSLGGTKWTPIPATKHYRTPADPQPWAQEPPAAWSGIDGDGQIKTTSFSVLRLNATDSLPKSAELQWKSHPEVDDEWSGFNGMAAADPSSDWNAPVEHWGNYEEPPVLMAAASLPKDQAALTKVSDDEKDAEDPSGGAAKSKKKRKKKKKTEDEPASDSQTQSQAPTVGAATKTQDLPVRPSNLKNASISSSQKKSEKTAEPLKPSQKKKVRMET